ncbi:hypothetical protein [Okeania sp. SIO2B3]|nr:hypothetical protein [Okeania sp. SIO2B3]
MTIKTLILGRELEDLRQLKVSRSLPSTFKLTAHKSRGRGV